MARLLLLDIETAPAIAYVWKLYDETIGIDQIIQPGRIICWGAKWLGDKEVHFADERKGKKKMLVEIHKLMCEADGIVTYNGDSFDLQKLDGAFVECGLPPTPPLTSIDLYKTVRRLGYQSAKLAFIGPYLHIGEKVKHEGFSLWSSCLNGDKKAWKRMREYNIQDVELLDGLYTLLRPHIRNHPHLGFGGECPACQSRYAQSRGIRRTRSYIINRMKCSDCGSWYDGKREKIAGGVRDLVGMRARTKERKHLRQALRPHGG